uniref:NADH dehydrogenase [ubiquinone] 1 alpha subcomplex subunit 12 n=2 Tax=Florenciella parvula TaxID=236787 RepID=A0A7S2GA95_9STRA
MAVRSMATYRNHDGMNALSLIDRKKPTPSIPPSEKVFLGSNLITKWMTGVKYYGLQKTIEQAYTLGDIKFGECVGTDVNGNQYFENLDYPHGQHRWVEYADIHNYDAASVPPEWHGWMTHMQDAPGSDAREFITEKLKTKLEIDKGDHSIYDHHVGHTTYEMDTLLNHTMHRKRGFNIGGIKQKPEEEDKYHKHAGSAQNKGSTGRFESQKGMEYWDPADPDGAEALKKKPYVRTRSLDEN